MSVFHATVSVGSQMPYLLEQAVNAAFAKRGVAVLTVPGDVGDLDVDGSATFALGGSGNVAAAADVAAVARVLNEADTITLLVGCGAREARNEVLEVAKTIAAPMIVTLKAKDGLEHDNPYQVGQSGLIGNPAAHLALHQADTLFLVGTDFPYRDWLPRDKKVIQFNIRPEHIGRRLSVSSALVGDAKVLLAQLIPLLMPRTDSKHLDRTAKSSRAGILRNCGLLPSRRRPHDWLRMIRPQFYASCASNSGWFKMEGFSLAWAGSTRSNHLTFATQLADPPSSAISDCNPPSRIATCSGCCVTCFLS